MNKPKPEDVTDVMIRAWEEQKRTKVQKLQFPTNNGGIATFYAVKPDRNVLNAVAKYSAANDFERSNKLMINSCVLAGDLEELETDDEMFFGLLSEITALFEAKKKI